MKTLMVLGVREEGHPYAHTPVRESYEVLMGTEQRLEQQRPSDAYILYDGGDVEEVLRSARDHAISGILGVGEAASLSASYVAQHLGLPGVPYAEEQLFHDLLRLREFQEQHALRVPRYRNLTQSVDTGGLSYPMFVGPADGHVLRHTVRVNDAGELAAARQQALHWSPGRRVIAQEDITGQPGNEGAVTVMSELIVRSGSLQPTIWCEALLDQGVRHYVPVGARYPARLSDVGRMLLQGECSRLVSLLQLQDAQLPVLAYCAPDSMPYLLRIGTRDGADIMTRFLTRLYHHDLHGDALRIAAGDRITFHRYREPAEGTFQAYYSIPIHRSGILRRIRFDESIRPYYKGYLHRLKQSQAIYADSSAGQSIGTVMLAFPCAEVMDRVLSQIQTLIHVEVDEFM